MSTAMGKAMLRDALQRYTTRHGFDRNTIDRLVAAATVDARARGACVGTSRSCTDRVLFVVRGLVDVELVRGAHENAQPVVEARYPAGRFLWLVTLPQTPAWSTVEVRATVIREGLIATLPLDTVVDVLIDLPPKTLLGLVFGSLRSLSLVGYRRALQLDGLLRDKVALEVDYLTRRFGRVQPGDHFAPPLTHLELARGVAASRPAVTRALSKLRR